MFNDNSQSDEEIANALGNNHSTLATTLANGFYNGNRLYVIEVLTKQLSTISCALLTAKVMDNLSQQHQGDLIALLEQTHHAKDK